ncbi:MAG: phosphoglycolate phosphatase [Alphaproteobacteria bacterium]|nr:phosphoglycolate phosphatase [Alphaproteobacteria bacterium]
MTQFAVQKIIFDLDGTLVDSAPDLHAATNHVLTQIGRDTVSLDQVRHMVGYGALKLIELGLEATGGMEDHTAEGLRPLFLDFYGQNITTHTRPFEGALDLLSHLKNEGYALAVCTNKPTVLTSPILQNLGMTPFFGAVTSGDTFPFRKPDPRHIIETANLLPGDGPILMVGDSRPDIDGAKAACAHSIAVSFGYSQYPAADLGADTVVDHLADIANLVSRA